MDSPAQQTSRSEISMESLPARLYISGIRVTVTGMVVNALLIVLKLIGGLSGSSTAMIADAIHSVSDFLTDFGVLVGLKFLSQPADRKHPYGHGRLETVISLLMGIIILFTGLGIIKNATQNIVLTMKGIYPKMPGTIALITGIISSTLSLHPYRCKKNRQPDTESKCLAPPYRCAFISCNGNRHQRSDVSRFTMDSA